MNSREDRIEDERLFDVDLRNLDREWARHPKQYHHYRMCLADARAEHELAKANRDLVAAELSLEIRREPARFGLVKITEDTVEKTVLIQKRYREAQDQVINTRHAVDVLEGMASALEHKKKALEMEVQLFLADYFSEPRNPKGYSREQMDEAMYQAKKRGDGR